MHTGRAIMMNCQGAPRLALLLPVLIIFCSVRCLEVNLNDEHNIKNQGVAGDSGIGIDLSARDRSLGNMMKDSSWQQNLLEPRSRSGQVSQDSAGGIPTAQKEKTQNVMSAISKSTVIDSQLHDRVSTVGGMRPIAQVKDKKEIGTTLDVEVNHRGQSDLASEAILTANNKNARSVIKKVDKALVFNSEQSATILDNGGVDALSRKGSHIPEQVTSTAGPKENVFKSHSLKRVRSKGLQNVHEMIQVSNRNNKYGLKKSSYLPEKSGKDYQSYKDFRDQSSKSLIKKLCDVAGKSVECYRHGNATCSCTGGLADCSGKRYVPNLPYIPKLPKVIKCVKFTFNDVRSLTESYFANISNFIVVDFSDNNLERVSLKTFQRLSNLQYLILNRNIMTYKYLRRVFEYAPSLRLDIMDQGLKEIPRGYFSLIKNNVTTKQLFMDRNYLVHLDMKEFAVLKPLEYLSVNNCSISSIKSYSVPSLSVLDLDYNRLSSFPETCQNRSVANLFEIQSRQNSTLGNSTVLPLYPKLSELYLGSNMITRIPDSDNLCLPKVESLHLFSNNIKSIQREAFSSLKSLKVIILDKQSNSNTKHGIINIGPRAFSAPALTTIYLSKNKINFHHRSVSKRMFEGCIALKVLVMDHNEFGWTDENDTMTLFKYPQNLQNLNLGNGNFTRIPSKELAQLPKLQNLYLYNNNLTGVPGGAFDNFPALKYLYLDENKITHVGRFSSKIKTQLKVLDISRNPFLCDCDLLEFQKWLKSPNSSDLFINRDKYLCADRQGVKVEDYVLNQQACLFSRTTYILFVVCLSVLMVTFIIFSIFFRYRWNIRLVLYEKRVAARGPPLVTIEGQEFKYDLFMVFCNDDEIWITDQLMYVLEDRWRLRVCNHQRDFIAGGFITDNIVQAMNASRRILVVVSSRFALSRWCNYELQLCQSHVITHDLPSLLVIQLDPIQSRDMTASMLALYNTTCFLQWAEDNRPLFWQRLHTMLKPLINLKQEERRQQLN